MINCTQTILLMRHAKSIEPSLKLKDFDRTLSERGRAQSLSMGKKLQSEGLNIDLAIISPAQRTKETWALVNEAMASNAQEIFEQSIYQGHENELAEILECNIKNGGNAILVGHNPGISMLAAKLAKKEISLSPGELVIFAKSPQQNLSKINFIKKLTHD